MIFTPFFLLAAFAQQSAVSAAEKGKPLESAAAAHERYERLFHSLWATVNAAFFDPKMNGVDFGAVRERYRPLLASVTSDEQFWELGTRMIRELRTSHLELIAPRAAGAGGPAMGVVTQRIRRGMFYHASAPGVAAEGLLPGDRFLTPADLRGPLGLSIPLQVESCAGVKRTVRASYKAVEEEPQHQRSILDRDGHRIAYAKLTRFSDDTITFADEFMASARDSDGMIIDVRGNSGGSMAALYLANYFAQASEPTVTLVGRKALAELGRMPTREDLAKMPKSIGRYKVAELREALGKYGQLTFWSETKGDAAYGKPVVVLVNGSTASAAEGFAWMMKGLAHAKIVGRRTAGALLRGETFDLPYGWKVSVPIFGLWDARGQSFADRALEPDVHIEWSRADDCADRDPDVEAAIKVLFGR